MTEKRATLCMIPPKDCKSSAQIIDTLTSALNHARTNTVHKIAIDMLSDAGSYHVSGETNE